MHGNVWKQKLDDERIFQCELKFSNKAFTQWQNFCRDLTQLSKALGFLFIIFEQDLCEQFYIYPAFGIHQELERMDHCDKHVNFWLFY